MKRSAGVVGIVGVVLFFVPVVAGLFAPRSTAANEALHPTRPERALGSRGEYQAVALKPRLQRSRDAGVAEDISQ
jgi:hypothetical protein